MFQILRNPNFDFMGRRNVWLTLSAIMIVAAIGILAVRGIERGIEFTGGTEIQLQYAGTPDIKGIRSALTGAGLDAQVTRIGEEAANEVYIRVALTDETEEEQTSISGLVQERLKAAGTGDFSLRSQSYIGPSIGGELINKALLAIFGSLLGMLIYIWIRFQFQWGLAAVVALSHDTLIVLGLFSLFGKELSLPVVAAFLTLIGYSVNDTVVVMDRVRENLRKKGASMDLPEVINLSINQTLSRTVITSGLTFVVTVAILIFGGPALNAFAFVLTAGVVIGTYSSIAVASPILILWKRFVSSRRKAPGKAGQRRGPARRKKVGSSSA